MTITTPTTSNTVGNRINSTVTASSSTLIAPSTTSTSVSGATFGFNDAWQNLEPIDHFLAAGAHDNTGRIPIDWIRYRDETTYRNQIRASITQFNNRGVQPHIALAGVSRPNVAAYSAMAQNFAIEHDGKIRGIEIWNEPNSVHYGSYSPSTYNNLLSNARVAIRAAKPGMTIISAGLAPTGNWVWFLKEISRANGDFVLGAHVYPQGDYPIKTATSQMNSVVEAATIGAKDRRVWITETGVSSGDRGEGGQAGLLPQLLEVVRKPPRVKAVLLHRLKDDPSFFPGSAWEQGLGVIRSNGTLKPAYSVLANA